ncbi:hypothetical protein ONA92_21735 [Mycobacteroides salmoniphilum]|uniref:hypothetical protein n=1 Tax=Mycobacteroides salmoniphilum TaxID=404941 RepID=UPI0035660CE1
MSINFGDGSSIIMPYKVFGAIEQEIENLATNPEALDNISLSNFSDKQNLIHFVQVKAMGHLCRFSSETAAKSLAQHFPQVSLPDNFFPEAKDFLDRTNQNSGGFVMGPTEIGVGIAERVYAGDIAIQPDISALLSEEQSGVLLQQFMVFALAVQYARGDFTL